MCETCGCSADEPEHEHTHDAPHFHPPHLHAHGDHGHHHNGASHTHGDRTHAHGDHAHGDHPHAHHDGTRVERLEHDLLARNREAAAVNRRWLADRRLFALNLVSSPGAGKTTLIERTIQDLRGEFPICVIEGDQSTDLDAERVRKAGGDVVQLNTGKGCHLDAPMVLTALEKLNPPSGALVLIENVGNLVCPALFDLGEAAKVLVCSVTEGDDKPLKYPYMFRACSVLLLNKMDLLPHVDFDMDRFHADVHRVHPPLEIIELSARQSTGIELWYSWLREAPAGANTPVGSPSRPIPHPL